MHSTTHPTMEAMQALYDCNGANERGSWDKHNHLALAWVKGLLPEYRGSAGNTSVLEENISRVLQAGTKVDFDKLASRASAKEHARRGDLQTPSPAKRAAPHNSQKPETQAEEAGAKRQRVLLEDLVKEVKDIRIKQEAVPMNAQQPQPGSRSRPPFNEANRCNRRSHRGRTTEATNSSSCHRRRRPIASRAPAGGHRRRAAGMLRVQEQRHSQRSLVLQLPKCQRGGAVAQNTKKKRQQAPRTKIRQQDGERCTLCEHLGARNTYSANAPTFWGACTAANTATTPANVP